jgi:hypothetical protein
VNPVKGEPLALPELQPATTSTPRAIVGAAWRHAFIGSSRSGPAQRCAGSMGPSCKPVPTPALPRKAWRTLPKEWSPCRGWLKVARPSTRWSSVSHASLSGLSGAPLVAAPLARPLEKTAVGGLSRDGWRSAGIRSSLNGVAAVGVRVGSSGKNRERAATIGSLSSSAVPIQEAACAPGDIARRLSVSECFAETLI